MFEIEQERHLQPRDVKVTQHLRHVCVVELANNLRIGDDLTVNDEIGDQFTDEMAPVMHRKLSLLFGGMSAGGKLENHRIFVELLIQSGFESVQDCYGSANDVFGDSFMFHGGDL